MVSEASKTVVFRECEKTMTELNKGRQLDIDEVRLIADLRIMHSKVHELFEVVSVLKRGHEENYIRNFADHAMLEKDIQRVDEIYLWFVRLKEEGLKLKKK
jgi:hypothetical protein